MRSSLEISLLYRIARATNAEALKVAVLEATVAMGARGFFCTLRCDRPHVEPVCWAFSSNPNWSDQYLSLGLGTSDSLLPQDISENGVFSWTLADTQNQARLFTAICEEANFYSGWVVRVSQDPIWKMAVVFTQPDNASQEALTAIREAIVVLSLALMHSLIVNIMPDVLSASLPKISNRELSCLSWAARGYTAGDIAAKLEISEPTVVFHINNLIRKLGVNNRTQAIAVGIAKGLTY